MVANIDRDAEVCTADGHFGELKHVIVAHDTREVTDLVVEHDGHDYLVAMGDVLTVEPGRVTLRGSASEHTYRRFDHDEFHSLDGDRARAESTGNAMRGGAPLLDAQGDHVMIATPEESSTQAVVDGGHDYELMRRPQSAPEYDDANELAETGLASAHTTEVPDYRPDSPTPIDDPLDVMRHPRI